MTCEIRPLARDALAEYDAHFARHRAESGRGDVHFMPFAPDDPDGPHGLNPAALEAGIDTPGWERWWAAFDGASIVGHVNLRGDHLKTGLHRCELGIGIERAFRGQRLGQRLMRVAIACCEREPALLWLDLRVFGHNATARALYTKLGFREIGVYADRFRIAGQSVDDVLMARRVARDS